MPYTDGWHGNWELKAVGTTMHELKCMRILVDFDRMMFSYAWNVW